MDILIKRKEPVPSIVLNTYWRFAAERQNIFFNRINGISPLTDDKILVRHKFTNAYRASDRVSQYLIKNVIYNNSSSSELDTLLRILFFKIFNKISTWELVEQEIGSINIKQFSFKKVNKILTEAKQSNETIYSGAYIMTSGRSIFGYETKHSNHLSLLEEHVSPSLLKRIQNSRSLKEVYNILLDIPTFGPFLAYQYTIDINYSNLINFSEMDFVVPGPGARDGIRKCFLSLGDYSEADVIRWVTEQQESEFKRLNIKFKSLWGRPLQLIDCQNLFCETDKYARVAHPDIQGISDRKRIKQIYKSSNHKIDYFFPPKWGINPYI
ncbi:nucleotide kinase domain-containing protein [Sphingobacterium multivorum]|uniref:nucleotide kinase domain-containing protein n=1 Tax=Sphingobacterium multivorum TaxID=28454 RepID=UPI0028A9F06E|nr:nucleotide kinase domain-containing protein [Sphingobacterium multivorum]